MLGPVGVRVLMACAEKEGVELKIAPETQRLNW